MISCSFLPKNCSEAVCNKSGFFIIFTCATPDLIQQIILKSIINFQYIFYQNSPVTVRGTPWAVSTFSHTGFSVMTSKESLCTSVTNHHAQAHPPTLVIFEREPQQPPKKFGSQHLTNGNGNFPSQCLPIHHTVWKIQKFSLTLFRKNFLKAMV